MDFLWDKGEMAKILQAQHQGNSYIIFSWAAWQTQETFHVFSSYYTYFSLDKKQFSLPEDAYSTIQPHNTPL